MSSKFRLCASSLGNWPILDLVRPQDELGDRLDRLRAPRFDVDQRVTVFEPGDRHDPGQFMFAGRDVVRYARLVIDVERRHIAAQLEEGRDHLAIAGDDGPLPVDLGRSPRIVSRNAAQQAVRFVEQRRIGCFRHAVGADALANRGLADRIVARLLTAQARDIDLIAQFAAHHLFGQRLRIIQNGRHDRQLILLIELRIAGVVDRAQIEIAAVAASRQVKLRHALPGFRWCWCGTGRDSSRRTGPANSRLRSSDR